MERCPGIGEGWGGTDFRLPSQELCWRLSESLLSQNFLPKFFNCISLILIGHLWTNPCGPRGGSALIGGLLMCLVLYMEVAPPEPKKLELCVARWLLKDNRVGKNSAIFPS